MTEMDEALEAFHRAITAAVPTMQEISDAFSNVDWSAFDLTPMEDESGGMTIDELLDDIDSALADHKGDQ